LAGGSALKGAGIIKAAPSFLGNVGGGAAYGAATTNDRTSGALAGGIGGGGGGAHGTTGGGGFSTGTLSNTAVSGTYGPGAINTGGGGGGSAYLGGSGIVIITSNTYAAANVTGNPNVTYTNGNTLAIYRFWQSGTIRW
jgi:hypothetical protein